jgi:Na+/proline symporter
MPESSYTWVAVCAYAILLVTVGVLSRRASSFRMFAIGARSTHPVVIGMAVAAGSVSSSTFVINPGLVWLYGYSAFVALALSSTVGLVLGLFLFSKSFRRIGEKFEALTVAQWVGDRYGSPNLRTFFGCISLLQVAYAVLIVVSLAQVLSKGLSLPVIPVAIFLVLFTCSYIALGGTSTLISANFLQCFVMTIVALLLIFSGGSHFADGIPAFFERLRAAGPFLADPVNPASDLYRDLLETVVAQFVMGLATALLPHLIVKTLYLRDDREVNTYLFTASSFMVLFKLVVIAGLYARLELGSAPGLSADNVMATYFVTHFSPVVRAVVTVGVIAAGFSTLESIVLALSSIFANDVVRPLRERLNLAPVEPLKLARVFFLILAPVVILLATRELLSTSVSVMIFAFQGVLAFTAAIVPVVGFGIYSKSQSSAAAFISAIVGLVSFYAMVLLQLTAYHTNPMIPGTIAVGLGLATFAIVDVVDRRLAALPKTDPTKPRTV